MDSSSIPKICAALTIWRWQDLFEILFISIIFYSISRWLSRHLNKRLLVLFYFYSLSIITAYAADLPVLLNLLIAAAPITAMLLILMHQETIQKNFIVARRITPTTHQPWIETLVQCCMIANGENKDIYGVIQRHDDISNYLLSPCPINSFIHKNILQTIIKSPLFEHEKLLWIQSHGNLSGINCTWQQLTNTLLPDPLFSCAAWQEQALIISAKTDALVFKSDHTTNLFTVIIRGTQAEKITAHNCVKIMYDYIQDKSISLRDQYNETKKPTSQPPASHP